MYIWKNNGIVIASRKLNIEELKSFFIADKCFDTNDITAFYRKFEHEIKESTINWRVYTLVQMGVLNRVGRGKFIIGKRKNYTPDVSIKLKAIYSKLSKEFPYLKFCVWETSVLNEFMLHQPGLFYFLIEVEKEAADSVFFFLKELKYSVFIDPTRELMDKYLPNEKEIVIIKPLITEAPILTVNGVNTASLEKILVDIFCNDVVFTAYQGSEMRTIFHEANIKYTLNLNRMLRYAARRGKKESFNKYLISTTNIRQ